MASMRRSIEKEQFWRRMLAEQLHSGLGVRGFCRARSISEASFYAWRRALPARDAEKNATGPERIATAPEPGRLIPVTVLRASQTSALPGSDAANTSDGVQRPWEIGTPGGFTLRFDSAASSETLARVLEILARCAARGTPSC